jgi:hypothetical protein
MSPKEEALRIHRELEYLRSVGDVMASQRKHGKASYKSRHRAKARWKKLRGTTR